MKKIVKVIVEKEIEVEIDDSLLIEEAVKEFSSYMWGTDVNGLFKYAAACAADGDRFIEGLGPAATVYDANFNSPETNVRYNIIYEDEEAEIMEDVA